MSLINKMLQDLDRRQALATAGDIPAVQVRSSVSERVVERKGNFWIIVGTLLAIGVGAGVWAAWQMRPTKLVSDSAFQAAAEAQKHALPLPGPAITTPPAAPVAPTAAQKPEAPAPAQATLAAPATPATATPPAAQPAEATPAEPFKLAQSIETPIRERVEPPPAPKQEPAPQAAPVKPAPAPIAQAAPAPEPKHEAREKAPPARPAREPKGRAAERPAKGSGKEIEKRERGKPVSEAAEAQYRRAVALLNGGRVSEAEDQFVGALHTDPAHAPARQAYVALLLEQKRVDTARRVLADGLAINPLQPAFALTLARIYAEQRDYPAALDVMDRAGSSARSPDFQSLRGAVLQRMSRHAEAVDAFYNSVRSSAQPGTTWIGLGISLEALGRRPEAVVAYRRALAAGPLTQELRDYAESRAKALE